MKPIPALTPLAFIYGAVTGIRNRLFDNNILPSEKFDVPLICIGNLNTGGTGKSSHVEYVARLLSTNHAIAILSRGYGRKTSGFILAKPGDTAAFIGDEPAQFLSTLPGVNIVVGENRKKAMKILQQKLPGLDAIIMDDGFQHRSVHAGLNILLTSWHRLFTRDKLLPAGSLRESPSGYSRADVIVITNCPGQAGESEKKKIIAEINPLPRQHLFFSTLHYQPLVGFGKNQDAEIVRKETDVLAVAGLADAGNFVKWLESEFKSVEFLSFPDHHSYNSRDIQKIQNRFDEFPSEKKIVITTMKDFVKLREHAMMARLPVYYQPVKVTFAEQQKDFDQIILNYVGKNK